MKVDVEGCQCHVLKSAEKLLGSGRVRYLMMEVTPMNVCGCNHKESMTTLLQCVAARMPCALTNLEAMVRDCTSVHTLTLASVCVRALVCAGKGSSRTTWSSFPTASRRWCSAWCRSRATCC